MSDKRSTKNKNPRAAAATEAATEPAARARSKRARKPAATEPRASKKTAAAAASSGPEAVVAGAKGGRARRPSGNGKAPAARANGAAPAADDHELLAELDFLDNNPFKAELADIRKRGAKTRQSRNRRARENPLLDLTLLADADEALIRGVSVIRQSLRDLVTGETARLVDSSTPSELAALGKRLETRKLILEAAVKELTGQLTRARNRQRELEAEPRGGSQGQKTERPTHA